MRQAIAKKKGIGPLYKARPGSQLSDDDAQVIGPRIAALGNGGAVNARTIVEDARGRRSPLHRFFEWDNNKAADEYRLEQARRLARSVVVVISDGNNETTTRAFHHVFVDGERGYTGAAVVFGRSALAEQVIERAAGELRGWMARYRQYKAMEPAIDLVEEAAETLGK